MGRLKLYIDFSGYAPDIPRERVVEWAQLPSGRVVVMTDSTHGVESFWFEPDGKSPKGSFLTPWPLESKAESRREVKAMFDKLRRMWARLRPTRVCREWTCPQCREARMDWLVWCDYGEYVRCVSCGKTYEPEPRRYVGSWR